MRQLWVAVVVICVTGCSAADLRRNLEPRTIDEATGPPALLAERGTVPGAIPTEVTSYINPSYTYYGLIKSSAESPGDSRLAAMLALSGMQQVDALCDEWFRQLALAQSELKATDDLVTAGGTLTAGILALANATNAAVGAVALATGFAHSLLTTAQVNFIAAPDVAVVAQTNRSLRAAEQTCVGRYARLGVLDNFRARKFIAEYAQMCTPVAVKELINQSIAARSITATPTSNGFCTSASTVNDSNILISVVQPPPPPSAIQPTTPAPLPAGVSPSTPIPPASVAPPDKDDVAVLNSAATNMSQVFCGASPTHHRASCSRIRYRAAGCQTFSFATAKATPNS